MKTKVELEKDILDISIKIHNEFPELSKYISEMPEKNSGINSFPMRTQNFKDYYQSLHNLVEEYSKTHVAKKQGKDIAISDLPGYPLYPPSEDLFQKAKKERGLNPEDISIHKTPNEPRNTSNERDFEQNMSGDDLDVPGSELDDEQEKMGNEDEENNYYSLGGDDHIDLEEDKG